MTTPLKEGMKPDLIVVGNEISHLWFHHDVFWKIADAFNGSERVQATGGHLINWFKNCYIEAGSVGLRRQLDRDDRSISLMNILTTIRDAAANFTKEDYQAMRTFRPGGHFHDAAVWKTAGEEFDNLFGNGGHVNDAIVQADMDKLTAGSATIREQVNKEIAHRDRKGMAGPKATGEIFEACLKVAEDLLRKYWKLFYTEDVGERRIPFDNHIDELFTFAWRE